MAPDESAAAPVSPGPPAQDTDLTPAADIYESAGGLVIVVELPGVPRDAIDIRVEKNMLRIGGTAAAPVAGETRPLHADFGAGKYVRRFALSDELDAANIAADLASGVLTLTIPRASAAKPRKIPVRKTD